MARGSFEFLPVGEFTDETTETRRHGGGTEKNVAAACNAREAGSDEMKVR